MSALTFHPIKFIEEVKARPGLYNPDHPLDRGERLELWKQVGAALFPDWDTYSKATAYDRVLQLQKKWRSFRDAYNRELRTRRADLSKSRKVYRYFKKMSFLGGFEGDLSPTEHSEAEEDQKFLYPVQQLQLKGDNSTVPEEEFTETTIPKVKRSKRKKRKRESSDSIHATEEFEIPMPMFSSDMTDNECDSDRLFLVSFAPEMRELPVHIKMWARAQIANIMQEAVNSHYNNTTPRSLSESRIKKQRHDISD